MDIQKRVAYFHNSLHHYFFPINIVDSIGKYMYDEDHPMKPKRIEMTHSLIEAYNLLPKMDVYVLFTNFI